MKKNPRLSLQILNANRIGELDILLSSLLSQTYKEWDLILLDESKTPSIQHKHISDLILRIKCNGHGVIYSHLPAIHNIGKRRNDCFELDAFKNELCVRIDDDSYCEPDYLELLVATYEYLISTGEKIGGVGGIVPVMGGPQHFKKLPKIFNEIRFNNEGDIVHMSDDGGYSYLNVNDYKIKCVLSHHLRSSFLFTREAFLAVDGFPLEYGFNGYREETDFSLKLAFKGYKMYTNPYAVCWHAQAGGGSRQFPQNEYRRLVINNDLHFKRKIKYWWKTQGGNPYET